MEVETDSPVNHDMISHEEASEIEKRFGTPFYIFSEDKFVENYKNLETAFTERYSRFIIAYSYKTNYIPYLCKIVKNMGGFAEVVSRLEYDLALKIGQLPEKIIFNDNETIIYQTIISSTVQIEVTKSTRFQQLKKYYDI